MLIIALQCNYFILNVHPANVGFANEDLGKFKVISISKGNMQDYRRMGFT
jgi:hypothetical protein